MTVYWDGTQFVQTEPYAPQAGVVDHTHTTNHAPTLDDNALIMDCLSDIAGLLEHAIDRAHAIMDLERRRNRNGHARKATGLVILIKLDGFIIECDDLLNHLKGETA